MTVAANIVRRCLPGLPTPEGNAGSPNTAGASAISADPFFQAFSRPQRSLTRAGNRQGERTLGTMSGMEPH